MTKRSMLLMAVFIALSIWLTACAGQAGPAGPVGPSGPAGPEGPQGPPSVQVASGSASPGSLPSAEYVGDQVCAGCHPDIYTNYKKSGHPWALNQVMDAKSPDMPFTEINDLPKGYTWNDISNVIGGYNWKALFLDKEGYIITDMPNNTGDKEYLNQWNFANELIGKKAGWVGYKSGEDKLLFSCGECHTTGYTKIGNQDGMPGLVGTWAQSGVTCEACHAPGSQHASDPQNIEMPVTSSSDLCTKCHSDADLSTVDNVEGANLLRPPAEAIYRGKHMVLDCVDCHDPHSGVVQARMQGQPTTSTACVECHYKEANYQNNASHNVMKLECTDCHLTRIVKAAWGDPTKFLGDIHSHQVAIDPSRFDQLVSTGDTQTYVLAPTGLNYACKQCHASGRAMPKTDAELQAAAKGYHNQP
jgi:predicted CXXCH cytochrome family protein